MTGERQTGLSGKGNKMEVLGIAVAILVFLVLSTVMGSFVTVSSAQVASIARFGQFHRVAGAGLQWEAPFIDRAGWFTGKSIAEIDQTNRRFLSHWPAPGSCSRC
jgi:regulator of protease activity HflC (stomatin/prohibitin superfamily)